MNSVRQWLRRLRLRTNPTQVVRIDSMPSGVALDDQDVEVLIGLCEQAMDEEPYTNRAVFLCRLIDKLEDWVLSQ